MYRKRLIAAAVSVFVLGVVFGIFVFSDTFSSCAVFLAALALSGVFLAGSARLNGNSVLKILSVTAVAVTVFSLGVLRVSIYKDSTQSLSKFDYIKDVAVLKISEADSNSIDARVETSEVGVPKGSLVRFYVDDYKGYDYISGDIITAEVSYRFRDTNNLLSNDIALTASGQIIEEQNGNGRLYNIRRSVSDNSKVLFEDFDNIEAISKGVTIGDRSDINSYIYSLYKTAGISHVLAISGLHISIIAMSLYKFLMLLTMNRNFSIIVSVFTAIGYTALVGFNVGAVRSAIMIMFMLLSRLFLRKSDGFTTMFIALFVLLMQNPFSVCSPGLQLSFLCSFGIMLIEPLINKVQIYFSSRKSRANKVQLFLYNFIPSVVSSLLITFVSTIFSFPVLCTGFDTVSYISPLMNIIAVPLFTLAIEISLVAYIIAPMSLVLAKAIAFPAGMLFEAVTELSQAVYDLDIGIMSVHLKYMVIPLVISLVMICSLMFLGKRRYAVFAICSFAFCISLVFCEAYNSLVYNGKAVVEYGYSDGEYFYSTEKNGIYVDMGGYTSCPEAVFKNGETAVDNYVILEYNSYSVKRLDYFSGNMRIVTIYLPKPKTSYDNLMYSRIKELANERNCDIITYGEYFSELSSIRVFGNEETVADETLVCADVGDIKIRVLGDGFDNAVNCDIAIATTHYDGDYKDINSEFAYACEKFITDNDARRYYTSFDECLRIEIDLSERDYKIYEP